MDERLGVLADRQRHAPYGLLGGGDGERGAVFVCDAGGVGDEDGTADDTVDWRRLPGKSTHDLLTGSVVSLRTPGPGGYGDPDDRDVRLGKLTPEAARRLYGVAVDRDGGGDGN